jgi:glycosyltransferase involved in cell wall biosynthesis
VKRTDRIQVLVDSTAVPPDERQAYLRTLSDVLGGTVVHAVAGTGQERSDAIGPRPADDAVYNACEAAFFRCADAGSHLLVVSGAAAPGVGAVEDLIRTLNIDPMFGIIHPRFVNEEGTLASAPYAASHDAAPVATEVLSVVPDYYYVPELWSPCALIRWELLANLAIAAGPWAGLAGLMTDYVARARRIGYRSVVSNRARVTLTPLPDVAAAALDGADRTRVVERNADMARATQFLSQRAQIETERLLALALEPSWSLLIDARNLNPIDNGTSKAILGLSDGLHGVRGEMPTSLWVNLDAAKYHNVRARYPGWTIETGGVPEARHAAALRLSQPWHLNEMLLLDRLAAVTSYLMLDCIAWDVVYTAPPMLDTVWHYLSQSADGLVFISEFSRQRYLRRFLTAEAVQTAVVHLSLDPRTYVEAEPAIHLAPSEPFWFVVGNTYDHKHVTPTVDVLTRAFPTRSFVVMGDRSPRRGSRVRRLQSGSTRETVMQAHYARADIVIFPSFYEGFALPIWNALAYGRSVLARDSALIRELAAVYRGPGRLHVFSSETSLVSGLATLIHGGELDAIPLGGIAGSPVHGWDSAAAELDSFLQLLVRRAPASPLRKLRSLAAALAGYPDVASKSRSALTAS